MAVLRIVRTATVVEYRELGPTDVNAAVEEANTETEDLFLTWGWRHNQQVAYRTETDVIWDNSEAQRGKH